MNQPIQTGASGHEPIVFINVFTVPPNESGRFMNGWKDNARIMAAQAGFVRARLHRCLNGGTELRFINVVEWATAEAFNKANANPEFLSSVRRMVSDPDLHMTAQPAVYQVDVEVQPGDPL